MNRTLKFALGAVLGLGLVMPATAQNFPDIPDNHWAYEALANLRGKVLFGYPDGLYRPARPMSRAEFAAAVNQLYQMMMAGNSSMSSSMNALKQRIDALENRPQGGATSADIAALKRQMSDLQNSVNGMKAWGSDIASLKRLAGEFEKELAGVGVDVDAMKKDMADLASRVSALEEGGGDSIEISGTGDFVMLNGHATDQNFGLTRTGRITGNGTGDFDGAHVGMTRDMSVFHEFNVVLEGEAGEGVSWKGSLVFGNMLGFEDDTSFGNGNSMNSGQPFSSDHDASMYFDELNVTFDDSVAGQGFTATAGRYRHSSGAFFLSRPDYTEFYSNDRWDDGDYIFDGGMVGFGFGSVDLTVFMGLNGDGVEAVSAEGFELHNMVRDISGDTFRATNNLGFELGADLGNNASVRGVYLLQDSDLEASGINRMATFGGEIEFSFDNLDIYGVYSQTNLNNNTAAVTDDDNAAMAIWASYDGGNWGANGGYAMVEGNFGAFGSWGRIGTEWNPANIEGFGGGLWFQASSDLSISANGGFWEGTDSGPGLFGLSLSPDDQVSNYAVQLKYDVNSAWDLTLGFENVDWDFDSDSDPIQRWYTLGLNYNLSESADISFLYMLSDVDFKGNGAGLDPFGDDVYKGGMLGTQVSFKF